MGVWRDINNKRGSKGGYWLIAADDKSEAYYRIKIIAAVVNKDQNQVDQFLFEEEILQTTQPKRPVGTNPSTVIKMNKKAGAGNVADMCRAGLASLFCDVMSKCDHDVLEGLCEELRKVDADATAKSEKYRAAMGEELYPPEELSAGRACADVLEAAFRDNVAVEPRMIVLSEPMIHWIGGERNPLEDVELVASAREGMTTGRESEKHPFTYIKWSVPADVTARAVGEAPEPAKTAPIERDGIPF